MSSVTVMELTETSANLLAQVFPALLIAILLEGRLTRRKNRSKRALRHFMLLRLGAVFTSVGATFMCIVVVFTGTSNAFMDIWVTSTLFIVFAGTLALCSEVFEKELLRWDKEDEEATAAPSTSANTEDLMRTERAK